MRIIPTKLHGYMDYMVGLLLIASPWLFDFAAGGPETWMPVMLGLGAIVYSLMTDYEAGFATTISMKTHLLIDFINGALLAMSPWLFGFSQYVYAPHLILGIMVISVSLMTRSTPEHHPLKYRRA